MGSVIHKSLLAECVVCNPEKQRREKRERRKKSGVVTLDVAVKRQLSAEIGEEEITAGKKFILLQKYGVAAPRIDRLVTKPTWMDERLWRQKQNDWMRATKGLAVAKQERRHGETSTRPVFRRRNGRKF